MVKLTEQEKIVNKFILDSINDIKDKITIKLVEKEELILNIIELILKKSNSKGKKRERLIKKLNSAFKEF